MKKKLVVLAVTLALGAWSGYLTGSGIASGGISAMFALGGVAFAMLILLSLAFVAVVLAKQPDGTGGPAARVTFTAAGLFAAGFGGGWLGSVALEPYRPVQLEAAGSVTLSLEGLTGYVVRGDATASCRSEVGSESVVWIEVEAAGAVGVDAVSVSLSMFPDDVAKQPVVGVSIVPAVKGPGATAQWSGSAELVEGVAGDRAGRATFFTLTLGPDISGYPSPGPGNGSFGQPTSWPLELSGSLTWSCGEWTR